MIGKTLAHYEILDKLGSGGMGDVYRARDIKLGREIALKVLPEEFSRDESRRKRFHREAQAIAALKHPNIVTIYSVEEAGGVDFLTMELVEGETLAKRIPADGVTLDQFFEYTISLAGALSSAHERGITHRDLKPNNVMFDRDGRLKVLDFGLAKRVDTARDAERAKTLVQSSDTAVGQIMGTPAYMSPEQAEGKETGTRSDVFSLGVVLYQLATGMSPFQRDNPAATIAAVLTIDPQLLSDVKPDLPVKLARIVSKCLRKNASERYSSAVPLYQDLDQLRKKGSDLQRESSALPEFQVAFDRGDWKEAYRLIHEIQKQRDLSPEELETLAWCAEWIGEFEECIHTCEKAHAAYTKLRRNVSAARVALKLVADCLNKNASAVAGGWLKKAERLLEKEPESLEHGNLHRRHSMVALEQSDFERALEANRQCGGIADRLGDPDLTAVALHDRGQILVARGEVTEGMSLVDEAMASAISGELTPYTVGLLFCRTLSVCESLADYTRAREWGDAAGRWCNNYGETLFQGVCRIHNAETMRHHGKWTEAEKAARTACEDFTKNGLDAHAAKALNELGELALRRGDYDEAEDSFRRAHKLGHDPVPGLPLLRLAQGKGQSALQTIERALSECGGSPLRRAKLLAANITIALSLGELSIVETAVAELARISEKFDCPLFKAHALMGKGALGLEQGDENAAAQALRDAWSKFNDMGLPYDAARVRIILAKAYLRSGNEEDAHLQLEAAGETFRKLGAKPELRVVAALSNP